MNLAILKNQAREVAKRREDRITAAIGENRDLTAEEEAAETADAAEFDRLSAQIKRLETINTGVSALGLAGALAAAQPVAAQSAPLVQPGATLIVPAQPRAQLDTAGFNNIAEFAQAVRFANPAAGGAFRIDERLAAPSNVHTEQGDTAGSYLVPAEFRQQIVDLVYAGDDPVINLIDPSPTSSNRVIGLGDETTPWGTSGIQAYWRVEAEQMTASKLSLTPRETVMNELYAFVLATEELLEDAPRIADLLTNKAAAAIRWKTVDAYIYGDGIAKPLGFFTSSALITIAKESGQAADSIVAANIAKMLARVINPSQAVWLANSDTLPQIMALQAGASGPLLWQPNFKDAPGGTLLGRPIYFTEHSKTVGDKGDLMLVNPMGYEAFRKQSGVQYAESIHLYFDYNIRAFRWIFRVGGQPVLSAPVSPANGSNTKSHFVALADRA
ncbi:phage major capsid protein [Sphingomonas sp. OTU376]|uniref:phage major capsid protein n=1 Tax=Sphingomonas sp. OTU376 TaxID=3043863 RepID=UPI00313AD132